MTETTEKRPTTDSLHDCPDCFKAQRIWVLKKTSNAERVWKEERCRRGRVSADPCFISPLIISWKERTCFTEMTQNHLDGLSERKWGWWWQGLMRGWDSIGILNQCSVAQPGFSQSYLFCVLSWYSKHLSVEETGSKWESSMPLSRFLDIIRDLCSCS